MEATCDLKCALPLRSHQGACKNAEGWRRARTINESTKVSDLTRVPSRSTQSGRSAWTATGDCITLSSVIQSSSPVAMQFEEETAAKAPEIRTYRGEPFALADQIYQQDT